MIVLDFRILGSFEVVDGDHRVALGGPQQRALLALLVLHRGEVVSVDRLIDELWNGRSPPTAAKIVQGYVSHLRRELGDGILVTRGSGYQLAAGPEQVDAERFRTRVSDGRRALAAGQVAEARELIGSAISLWRGEALADLLFEQFAQEDAARLEEERVAAVEDRIEADLILGSHHDLVAELEVLTRRHPNRDRLLAQLMLALYRSGRQSDALEAYRRGRRALIDQFGLDPGPDLRRLERRILEQDASLDLPDRPQTAARPMPGRITLAQLDGPRLLVLGGVLLLAVAAAATVLALRGGQGPIVRAAANSVAGIDVRSDRVDAAVGVGVGPAAIAYGSGSLWVANTDDETISRIDPETLQPLRTIPLKQEPTGLAAARGGVWAVTESPSGDFVTADGIDPQFDIVDHSVRVASVDSATPVAVAARADSVWVAPYSGELTRLNSTNGLVEHQLDPGASPTGVAIGDGATWLTDSEANEVVRIDPTGLIQTIPVGGGPAGIAVGAGAVWAADTGADAVVRIDPVTQAVMTTIPVGHAPLGVAVGAGSVWVANSGDGTVSRIDPGTDRVVATIPVGGSPQQIVVTRGKAWVTVDASVFPRTVAGSGATLRVDSADDVDYMDPALAYGPLSWQLLYATCAKLLNYPDKSGTAASQLVPEVARSMPAVSPDGTTYTFTLRDGFRFAPPSNQPVTAETFRETIERTLNPAMDSAVALEFRNVVGAKAYMAGKASHISGVVVHGDQLIIHLIEPEPDLPDRLAQPFFCAVPPDTPINPNGVRVIASAGPYTTRSYVPGQGIVLVRNPNYHGDRPRYFARIDVAVDVPSAQAIAQVQSGKADYAVDGEVSAAQAPRLAARYGAGSAAAKTGHQQYFVNPAPEMALFTLNTRRWLFSHQRLREAVNLAINRRALARLGDIHSSMPDTPTGNYLPPGIPGHRDISVYAPTPDMEKARRLARGFGGSTVVLYTCDDLNCGTEAQIVKSDLAAIGLRVVVKTFAVTALFSQYKVANAPYDMGYAWWGADYPDPDDFLNLMLETNEIFPSFEDPTYRKQLAAAARLTGVDRYLTYAKLDKELASRAAPWVVVSNSRMHDFFSARVGCQVSSPLYNMDLTALCVRTPKPRPDERSTRGEPHPY